MPIPPFAGFPTGATQPQTSPTVATRPDVDAAAVATGRPPAPAGVNPHLVAPPQAAPSAYSLTTGITLTSPHSPARIWAGALLAMQSAPLLFAAAMMTFPDRITGEYADFDNPFGHAAHVSYGAALAFGVLFLVLFAAGIAISQGLRLGRTLALIGEATCVVGMVALVATSQETVPHPWVGVAILGVVPVVISVLVCLPGTVSD